MDKTRWVFYVLQNVISECAPGNKGLFLRNYQFKVCSSNSKAICQRSLDNKIRYFYLMCASTKGLLAYNCNEISWIGTLNQIVTSKQREQETY